MTNLCIKLFKYLFFLPLLDVWIGENEQCHENVCSFQSRRKDFLNKGQTLELHHRIGFKIKVPHIIGLEFNGVSICGTETANNRVERCADNDINPINCTCKPYEKCKWGNETVFELGELLHKGDPLWKEKGKFFNERICNQKTRSVYCCKDEKAPTKKELNILKNYEEKQKVNHAMKKTNK